MATTYRTTDLDKWGAGKGAPLTAAEMDANFFGIMQRIAGLETNPTQPVNIDSFVVAGRNFTVVMTDASTKGPFELPLATFKWKGAWAQFEVYEALDMFYVDDMGLYIVLTGHTSGYSFEPLKQVGNLPAYSQIFGPTTLYDMGFFISGVPGLSMPEGSPLMQVVAARTIVLPQSSRYSSIGTVYIREAPDSELNFPIYVLDSDYTTESTEDLVSVGSIIIPSGENSGYISIPENVEVPEGGVFYIGQDPVPSGSDLSITIRAVRGITMSTVYPDAGTFIINMADGTISKDSTTLEVGHFLEDGTVLKFNAEEELAPLDADDFDTEGLLDTVILAGILLGEADSTSEALADVNYIARLAEVDLDLLTYFDGVSNAQIEVVNQAFVTRAIIVRNRGTEASPLLFQIASGGGGGAVDSVAGLTGVISAVGLKSALAIAAGDISGLAASATTNALNASNISSGTLNAARLPSLSGTYVATSTLGAANGTATLGADSKLTSSQIPASLVGAVVYQGVWNAFTNSPTLASSTGTKGFYYKVSVGGDTTLDGIDEWFIGDTVIFNGTTWDKIDGQDVEVLSVAGLTGAISASGLKSALAIASGDVSGLVASATTDTTNASNISSGTLGADRLPNPSASTLGGVRSIAAESHKFLTTISTSGVPSLGQPAAGDISGLAASATTDTTNASNISSGTLNAARLPAAIPSSSITGTATNDNAASGVVGEYVSGSRSYADRMSATSGAWVDVASVALTAGDWEIWGCLIVDPNGSSITNIASGASSAAGTYGEYQQLSYTTTLGAALATTRVRVSLASSGTAYLGAYMGFTGGPTKLYGNICARRIR